MTRTKIIVCGIAGRMGSCVAEIVRQNPNLQLVGGTEAAANLRIGNQAAEAAPIVDDLEKIIAQGDVVIDFTAPESSLHNAAIVKKYQKAIVIGTTGFSLQEKSKLLELTESIPCVMAPNMSIGVNVMFKVAAEIAQLLGPDYDIEIVEAHHRLKKDAPSGTALGLGEAIATALGKPLEQLARYERHGQIGPRSAAEIGIQTLRAGDIVGDHTVMFAGMGERLELTHRATSRENFARGAVRAAQWLNGKSNGLYDMQDVLGFK